MLTGFRFRVPIAFGALVTAFLLVVPSVGAQQGGTVTGRVLDSQSGQPVSAVQVFISTLDLGGLTQQNGRYLLQNIPAGTHTLTVARIGYRSVDAQVTVAGGQTVEQNFNIAEEALQLDEIIVTGTPGGTQRRAIGNAVAVVDVGDIVADVAVSNFQDLLSGRATGLQFSRMSGNVGAGSPIKIRGAGSFNLGASPLIYVDGIRVNNNSRAGPSLGQGSGDANVLDDFNPADIESIEIIKGPAAASLYGTEASAGVIQIITKKGVEGAPVWDISVRRGINTMVDPAGKLGTQYTCATDPGPGPVDCSTEAELSTYNMYEEGTRYISEGYFPWPTENLFQNGPSQSYNVGVRGGNSTVRYFISTNYETEEGVVYYNKDETFRLRGNMNLVFSDAFSLDVSTGYVDGITRFGSPVTSDGGIWQDLSWSNGYYLDRITAFDYAGAGALAGNARLGGFQEHLPTDVVDVEATRDYSRFTGAATLSHSFGTWLNQRAVVGIDKGWDINRNVFPLEEGLVPEHLQNATSRWGAVYTETVTGQMTYQRDVTTNLSFDYSVTADYDLNDTWSFGTSFGAQYYTAERDGFSNKGNGFASPLSRTVNHLAADQIAIGYSLIADKSLGFYVQEQLSYRDRMFVTGSMRFDDNSTFGADAPSQKYPNVQGTWVMSEESFWNFDAINSFRVRGAWGKAGRQPSATAGTTIYTVFPGSGGGSAIRVSSPGNPMVEPEVSTELELGVDFALLDDRISGEFTHYQRKDENALLSVSSPPSFGIPGSVQQNLGRIDNWGWEAQMSLRVFQNDAFAFDLDLAADYTMNEIVSLGDYPGTATIAIGLPYPSHINDDVIVSAEWDPAGDRRNVFNQPMSAMCDSGISLAPASVTDPDEIDKYGILPGGTPAPCADIANTNISVGPNFSTHTFRVAPRLSLLDNQLQIFALAEGQYGRINSDNTIEWAHIYDNTKASRLEDDPVYSYGTQIGDDYSREIYDAGFWRIRELGARYSFSPELAGRIGASRASLAFTARNLFTPWLEQKKIYGGRVVDPEFGTPTLDSDGSYHQMPPTASLNLTIRASF